MEVYKAKEIARMWVENRAKELPDFSGAYFVGSIINMCDDEEFPATSDIDIRIILDRDIPHVSYTLDGEFAQRKLLYHDAILEPLYRSKDNLGDAESLLSNPFLASCFNQANIIVDPTGYLSKLHRQVSALYADEIWVRKRCAIAKENVLTELAGITDGQPHLPGYSSSFIEHFTFFYFVAINIAAQIPCLANLKAMTMRKGLVNSRDTLVDTANPELYENILKIVGVQAVTEGEVHDFITQLTSAYTYALRVIKTRFYGDFDVNPISKSILIDGSRELLDAGFHRESMYWIACTYALVQNAIENDGTEPEKTQFRIAYNHLLSAIGIRDTQDVATKAKALKQIMPEIMSTAHEIINQHSDIIHNS